MTDKKLTILMLVTKRQYRGAEISAFNLSKSLVEKGHKVIWVGLYSFKGENPLILKESINVDLPDSTFWLSFKKLKALARLYSKYRPDIVQANGSDTLRYLVALKLLGDKAKLVYRNISIISKWVNTKPKYYLFKFLFSKTDKVVSVGEEALQDFNNFFKFSESKAQVIRRGIPLLQPNLSEVEVIKKRYSISDDDFVFIHIGHFSVEKNHHFLLNVWETLVSKYTNIKLVLLGNGSLNKEINALVHSKNLTTSVLLPGLQTNITDWLAISKIMLLCSTVEGVPGVVIEAAMQGVPTVAVNVGGVKEVLTDGENGLLVSHHDIELFSLKCDQLLTNASMLSSFSEKSKILVTERFDLEKNTYAFINVYYSII
jgi:glycosyltransferase involved in cell wall biosynthesis